MKIKIAICDTGFQDCLYIEQMLEKIVKEFGMKCEADFFHSEEKLYDKMVQTEYDLIFLDIDLPIMDGIKIGNYIREIMKNPVIQIVYISKNDIYVPELFDARPINFLVKPVTESRLRKVIRQYLLLRKQENIFFEYKKGYEYFKLPISEIVYFESRDKKITIVTVDEKHEYYDSMENVYSKVKESNFLFIHKSFIVNYDFVKKFCYDSIELVNGVILPISQSRRKKIREIHMNHIKKER